MSFADTVYPKRHNRIEFIDELLRQLDRGWRQVTDLGRQQARPGFILRGDFESRGPFRRTWVDNFSPTALDKRRVRVLLKAWARRISDRYLDLNLVSRAAAQNLVGSVGGLHSTRRDSAVQRAYDAIGRNAGSGGAVSFIMNGLERERTNGKPTFFGDLMFPNYNYDSYFTTLLYWGDVHCYGLIRELQMQDARNHGAGGTTVHPAWEAARDWLRHNRNRGVYQEYDLVFT